MSRELVTRGDLKRALAINAATKPSAIAVGAGVAAAAFLLGAMWLLIVAVLVYVGLALATFFDGDEAERVGQEAYARARGGMRALPKGLAPELRALVERARVEERRINEALAGSVAANELTAEVDAAASEMERVASRAQVIRDYLEQQNAADVRRRLIELTRRQQDRPDETPARARAIAALRDQLAVLETMQGELARFEAEMEHLIASLAVIHGQIVRMNVAGEGITQERVANDVRDLRARVSSFARGMTDAGAEIGNT